MEPFFSVSAFSLGFIRIEVSDSVWKCLPSQLSTDLGVKKTWEDALSVCNRFVTGGMSVGALSREAHEVIALGMNRIGGMSNSGEGGEDPVRFHPIEDWLHSYIFGIVYLLNILFIPV